MYLDFSCISKQTKHKTNKHNALNEWKIIGNIMKPNTLFEFSYFYAKAELLLLKLIQIFARAVLVMKKLEIEETKTT